MSDCSNRLSRAIEEVAIALQEVSRLERSEEAYESSADAQFDRYEVLQSALEKIASSSTKSVASCKKIAEEALDEVRPGLFD
jgi:hypothetical protein